MSALPAPPATEHRGPGRPRKEQPVATETTSDASVQSEPAADTRQLWYGLPCMPDDEMEQYGGDLSALDSWSKKSGRPFASWRDAPPISRAMPDLAAKGLLVNRHAPEQLFHYAYLTEDGSPNFQQAMLTMRLRGYKPTTVADWYVHSLLRDILVPEDGTGRLTLGGAMKGGSTVVYAQDEASYRRIKNLERAQSNEIQKTTAQRQAEMQEGINRDGLAGITVTQTFDDE